MPDTYGITGPDGGALEIPAAVDAASDPYSRLGSDAERRAYYEANGYLVLRGVISPEDCDAARASFESEVKPFTGYLYRQATANPETHVLTRHGHMLNSLLNLQDLDSRAFPRLRSRGLGIIASDAMRHAVASLLGGEGVLVLSMYFEGNPVTWAHQDTYYLDGEPLGSMAAAWIALEDIHPGSGRFYVYPGSHRIDMVKNGGDFDIALNHDRYKNLVLDVIRKFDLECRAPAMNEGDVLFWNARTIHGSLETREPARSRSSITAHFIPASGRFMQFQARARRLQLEQFDGLAVHCPKSQRRWSNRAVMAIEIRFPRAYRLAKKIAVKALTR